ncbi:hypothetical protein BpHYR1_047847 [Brachionus plicatilis]|uniref:Uncharacterized protein n=1 Tax=Brachionus plicatilis TaxID=10195 RepID=A0A3M7PIR2_BRAPC|nr:hypothetical protein BpHYR1_047847 [Brachionus plicatilis]
MLIFGFKYNYKREIFIDIMLITDFKLRLNIAMKIKNQNFRFLKLFNINMTLLSQATTSRKSVAKFLDRNKERIGIVKS